MEIGCFEPTAMSPLWSTAASVAVAAISGTIAILLFIAEGNDRVTLARSLHPIYGTTVDTFIRNTEGNIVVEGVIVQLRPKIWFAVGLLVAAVYYAFAVWQAIVLNRKGKELRGLLVLVDIPSIAIDSGILFLAELYARELWLADITVWALVAVIIASLRALLHSFSALAPRPVKRRRRKYELGIILNTLAFLLSVLLIWRLFLLGRATIDADAEVPGWQYATMIGVPVIYAVRALATWGFVVLATVEPNRNFSRRFASAIDWYIAAHLFFILSWILLVGVSMTVGMWSD